MLKKQSKNGIQILLFAHLHPMQTLSHRSDGKNSYISKLCTYTEKVHCGLLLLSHCKDF